MCVCVRSQFLVVVADFRRCCVELQTFLFARVFGVTVRSIMFGRRRHWSLSLCCFQMLDLLLPTCYDGVGALPPKINTTIPSCLLIYGPSLSIWKFTSCPCRLKLPNHVQKTSHLDFKWTSQNPLYFLLKNKQRNQRLIPLGLGSIGQATCDECAQANESGSIGCCPTSSENWPVEQGFMSGTPGCLVPERGAFHSCKRL